MARIYPLYSSSSGNCTYIGNEKSGILVDAGVSCKKICCALEENSISPQKVLAIIITHTHTDHIQGLKVLGKKYKIPVYAQKTNLDILIESNKISQECRLEEVEPEQPFEIGDFQITAFPTPHDTPASCGYIINTPDGKSCGICTDLGCITDKTDSFLQGCDLVLIESNYDEKMLKNGSYPYDLKKRIASDHGHLSNNDCSKELVKLMQGGTFKFILGHLSQENNTVQTAEKAAQQALSEYERNRDYLLYTAKVQGDGLAVAF